MELDLSVDDVKLLLQALNAAQVSGRDARRAVGSVEAKLDKALEDAVIPVQKEA